MKRIILHVEISSMNQCAKVVCLRVLMWTKNLQYLSCCCGCLDVFSLIPVVACTLTGHVQQVTKSLGEDVGTADTVIHGDVLDRDEGTNIQRSSPRVLT